MVEDRAEAGKRALGSFSGVLSLQLGCCTDCTYRKLLDSLVQSVLLYEAEAWGCLRGLESLEQVQLRALRFYFGVPT